MSRRARNNNTTTPNMEYLSSRKGRISEFLWTCAGVNKDILRQCPGDYAKYAGIGGTILFTALMASLSGGYAMNFVFNNPLISIAFGIFWGLLIFNLDRFIVNTMYSDGKHTISWGELKSGLPRIIMAIFLGIVISTPLEMKIFEDRINHQLVYDNAVRNNETKSKADEINKPLEARRDKLEAERTEISTRLAKANKELKEEGEGAALSGIVGHGPIYADKEANRDAIQKELDDWDKAHSEELTDIKNQIQTNAQNNREQIKKGTTENGFCVRYEAFSNIKENNVSLQIVSIVIMLLFIIIETAPTFFKMMMEDGPYDDLLNAEKHRVRVLSQKQMSDVNDKVNTSVKISTMKNQKRIEAETLANQDILEKIARIQTSLLEEALELWRQDELAKIHDNPSRYIIRRQDTLEHFQEEGQRVGNPIQELSEEDSQVASESISEIINSESINQTAENVEKILETATQDEIEENINLSESSSLATTEDVSESTDENVITSETEPNNNSLSEASSENNNESSNDNRETPNT